MSSVALVPLFFSYFRFTYPVIFETFFFLCLALPNVSLKLFLTNTHKLSSWNILENQATTTATSGSVFFCSVCVVLKKVWIAAYPDLVAFIKLFVQAKKIAYRHTGVFHGESALACTELYWRQEIIPLMICRILEMEFCCLLSPHQVFFSVFFNKNMTIYSNGFRKHFIIILYHYISN